MTAIAIDTIRRLEPGTTGWTVDDLDDPEIARQWEWGRYEIVEGVLATMPAAYFSGGAVIMNLARILGNHLESVGLNWRIASEVDIVLTKTRVLVADAALLSDEDERRQREAVKRTTGGDPDRSRLLIAPTLVIESVSPGHEIHDRVLKRRWYAEAGVANYWIVNAYERTMECLALSGAEYRVDQAGRDADELRPAMFAGLVIPLAKVWGR